MKNWFHAVAVGVNHSPESKLPGKFVITMNDDVTLVAPST